MTPAASVHLKRAENFLRVSRDMVNLGHYSDSVSRSYYGAFHAIKAVLAELDKKRKSHHAAWAAFGEYVTAPGLMDKRFHRDGWDLFNRRLEADYMAEPEESLEGAEECLVFAAEMVAACRTFLENRKGA